MQIIETPIKDLVIIDPRVFNDERGFFFESYNKERYHAAGIKQDFIQDNFSKSTYGVIRGLHFQKPPYSQAKLVQVIEGSVFDVAVDLRSDSETYGQWYGAELTAENHRQFLIPQGFAHGFAVLSEVAVFSYKCDNLYHPEAEGGVMYNDATLNIDWRIPADKAVISPKDLKNSLFVELEKIF
ncbi:MAG: dTDP-4-dehydrorhamnose 3,5-epimerase [bacterium]